MATVGIEYGSLYRRTHSLSRLVWSEGRRPLGAVLHSLNEPAELSQWLCHDDSPIVIGIMIMITITITITLKNVITITIITIIIYRPGAIISPLTLTVWTT